MASPCRSCKLTRAQAERELATARIDLEACRFKIADLEKELDAQNIKASFGSAFLLFFPCSGSR